MNTEALWAMDCPEPFSEKSVEEFDPRWSELVKLESAWMIEVDQKPVGHFGWVPHGVCMGEFYIVIGESSQWRKGIGQGAVQWMLDAARGRDMLALFGRVLGHNVHALNFFARCGFQPFAKAEGYFERDGKRHDLHWIVQHL